jgi:hypothetical protein
VKESLRCALLNFYDAMATLVPALFLSRTKIHLLAHAIEHIERFSLLKNYAEDPFERENGPLRLRSIFSNRQSASRDIGRTTERAEIMVHLLSGGWFYSPVYRKWIQAASSVRGFMARAPVFRRLYGLEEPHKTSKNAGEPARRSSV